MRTQLVGRAKRAGGVGMIEVLITLVVISAGLLAYVSMQRGIYREANLSSGRVAATELALAKLEDLRGFSRLYTTGGHFAFQDIAANTGGTIASGTITVDNIVFTRTWTVTDYWIAAGNTAGTTTTPSGNPVPSFKLVTVSVSWTEQSGASQPGTATSPQTLTLPSIIAGIDPAFTATIFY